MHTIASWKGFFRFFFYSTRMYANFTGRFQYSTAIGVNVRVMRKFLVPTANDYVDACAVFNCTAIYDRISPYIIHTWRMTYVSWNFLFYDNTIVEKFFFFISIRVKGQWSSHASFPRERWERKSFFPIFLSIPSHLSSYLKINILGSRFSVFKSRLNIRVYPFFSFPRFSDRRKIQRVEREIKILGLDALKRIRKRSTHRQQRAP